MSSKTITGLTTTKAQRKLRGAEIEEASARGRAGRTANFVLIGFVTDQECLAWLMHSSVLRPSGYVAGSQPRGSSSRPYRSS
ncbi:MAG TPA: hypothetical protein VMU57_17670 [Edaphobacter sp.]|uniref:hypothetical protein n=1 Tax=Edaphobacter sp. TaxID=1934404 RepID=UPI002C75ED6C|nr:hypothetical protein [Edaphobacter sp.]HUZ96735.1 hypothetical protein [Edaphobacter sp.]